MKEIYEWLYDHYAEPVLNEKPLFQDQVLEEALSAAPEDLRLRLFDQVAGLRLRWCTEAFAPGASSWGWRWRRRRGGCRTTAPDRSSAPSRRRG